jgi:PAS domain S-box-containing protein
MTVELMDPSILAAPRDALEFITNILQASTEYSIIGKNLDGGILLWNEGAHRLYGYGPDEVVGKANSSILHTPEDNRGRRTERNYGNRASGWKVGRNGPAG